MPGTRSRKLKIQKEAKLPSLASEPSHLQSFQGVEKGREEACAAPTISSPSSSDRCSGRQRRHRTERKPLLSFFKPLNNLDLGRQGQQGQQSCQPRAKRRFSFGPVQRNPSTTDNETGD
jgi:hypothetical protein